MFEHTHTQSIVISQMFYFHYRLTIIKKKKKNDNLQCILVIPKTKRSVHKAMPCRVSRWARRAPPPGPVAAPELPGQVERERPLFASRNIVEHQVFGHL